jgi:hypothetical protein
VSYFMQTSQARATESLLALTSRREENWKARPEENDMSAFTTTRIIAIGIAAAIAASTTSTAWAARTKPTEERGLKTYLPGEGGCKDEMLFWNSPCND